MLFFGVCFLLSYLKLSAGNELGLLILKLPFTLSHMLEQIVISLSCIFGNWSLWRPAWPALRGSFDKKKKKKKKISHTTRPHVFIYFTQRIVCDPVTVGYRFIVIYGPQFHFTWTWNGIVQKFPNYKDFCPNRSDSNQDICYLTKLKRQQKLTRKAV